MGIATPTAATSTTGYPVMPFLPPRWGRWSSKANLLLTIPNTSAVLQEVEQELHAPFSIKERVDRLVESSSEHTSTEGGSTRVHTEPGSIANPLNAILSAIASLLHDEDEECRPSLAALGDTLDLLMALPVSFGDNIPEACVAADSEGGVNISWSSRNRQLHLTIPARGKCRGFIYHESAGRYAIDRDIAVGNLTHWLHWFADA